MPSNAGGVSVKLRLDDRDALKDLASLRGKIESLNASLNQKRSQRNSVLEEMNKADMRAEQARISVEELKAALASAPAGEKAGIRAQLTAANEELRIATSEATRLDKELKKIDASIATGEQNVQQMEEQAGNLVKQVEASNSAMAKLESASAQAAGKMEKAFERLGRMLRRVFVFTVVTKALREIREYLQDVLMSTPDFAAAFGQFKGALLTLVQPILQVLIPALTRLMQIITAVVTALAGLVSKVFGMSLQQSKDNASALYDQASAYKATGSAAKKAANQLAAFDQLNVLQDNSSDGSGGSGSGTSAAVQPSFELPDLGEDKLREILDIVTLIGAGLLGWKISDVFGLGLEKAVGIALLLWGTLKLVREYLDAWDEGINADNLKGMLLGLTALAAGLFLAFGKVAGAIGLIVGGIALLVLGFKDIVENGVTLENKMTVIAGLLAAGLGISILTGSFLPLLIAGLLAVGVGFVDLAGKGEELQEGLTEIFEGFSEFFTAVFVDHDMAAAAEALKKIWGGLKKVAESIIAGIQYAWEMFLGWLEDNASPEIYAIFEDIGKAFGDLWQDVKDIFNGVIEFITGVFTGDWEKAWNGFKDIGKGVLNLLIDLFEGFLNIGYDLVNLLLSAINSISIEIPDWVPIFGGKTFAPNIPINKNMRVTLPRLATGAVIPPNREFMAVLGDQKSGTNIEAPLDTIVQAFQAAGGGNAAEAIFQMGNLILAAIQNQELTAYMDSTQVSRALYSPMQIVAKNRGAALVGG